MCLRWYAGCCRSRVSAEEIDVAGHAFVKSFHGVRYQVRDVEQSHGMSILIEHRQFTDLVPFQYLDRIADSCTQPCGQWITRHHPGYRLIEGVIAAALEQTRQVAVGEQSRQPAALVQQQFIL